MLRLAAFTAADSSIHHSWNVLTQSYNPRLINVLECPLSKTSAVCIAKTAPTSQLQKVLCLAPLSRLQVMIVTTTLAAALVLFGLRAGHVTSPELLAFMLALWGLGFLMAVLAQQLLPLPSLPEDARRFFADTTELVNQQRHLNNRLADCPFQLRGTSLVPQTCRYGPLPIRHSLVGPTHGLHAKGRSDFSSSQERLLIFQSNPSPLSMSTASSEISKTGECVTRSAVQQV